VFVNLVVASSKQISASRFLLTGAGKGQCREKAMFTEMPRRIDFQEKEISVGKAVKRKMRQENIKQRDLERTQCVKKVTLFWPQPIVQNIADSNSCKKNHAPISRFLSLSLPPSPC